MGNMDEGVGDMVGMGDMDIWMGVGIYRWSGRVKEWQIWMGVADFNGRGGEGSGIFFEVKGRFRNGMIYILYQLWLFLPKKCKKWFRNVS